MSTSPFMDDYSSEDYSEHDDDYYFVPTATSLPQVRAQVGIQTQSNNELQNVIIDQQEVLIESVYFDVLPELGAETAEEEGGGMEQSIYLAVESYYDLEAQAETGVAAVLKVETTVEELAVGSFFNLEAQIETGLPASLEAENVLEEGDVIESDSLETVEADTVVERMIEDFVYEALQPRSGLEAEDTIEESNSDVENEADAVAPEAENAVDADAIGESIYKVLESEYDLTGEPEDLVEEQDDMVEEEDDFVEEEDGMVEEEDDMVEEEGDMVEEEDDMDEEEDDMDEEEDDMVEEEDDMVEEEGDMVEEEHDVINEPVELDGDLQAEAEALVEEGDVMEEFIYKPLESNSVLLGEDPKALAAAVSIEMITFKAQEPDSALESEEPQDLIDGQSDSSEEESDVREEEWDSDAEEIDIDPEDSDMDFSDSDLSEEGEDDVVVSYLKSSSTIQGKAWNFLVPASASASALAWAKLPVTDTTNLEDSFLRESFLGCSPMLMLQECGNAVMNVIETLLCELLRIRNNLRRFLGALFHKRETTNHA